MGVKLILDWTRSKEITGNLNQYLFAGENTQPRQSVASTRSILIKKKKKNTLARLSFCDNERINVCYFKKIDLSTL